MLRDINIDNSVRIFGGARPSVVYMYPQRINGRAIEFVP